VGDRQTEQVLTVGRPDEWAYFQATYPDFLKHVPKVVAFAERVIKSEVEFEPPVNIVIHGLTMMCIEEFMEIVLVCGNGYGIAGLKLLRTMYEDAVTAHYLYLEPAEVGKFLDYLFVAEKKVMDAIEREGGAMPPELREHTHREFERVKAAFIVKLCRECGRTGLNYRWSELDFVSMAMKCKGLSRLIVPAYLSLVNYTHASVGGLLARHEAQCDGFGFRTAPHHEEARTALMVADDIILLSLALYIEHFKLGGFDKEVVELVDESESIQRVPQQDEKGAGPADETKKPPPA
jgi:hypothetical protein